MANYFEEPFYSRVLEKVDDLGITNSVGAQRHLKTLRSELKWLHDEDYYHGKDLWRRTQALHRSIRAEEEALQKGLRVDELVRREMDEEEALRNGNIS